MTLTTQSFIFCRKFPHKQIFPLQQGGKQPAARVHGTDNIPLFFWLLTDIHSSGTRTQMLTIQEQRVFHESRERRMCYPFKNDTCRDSRMSKTSFACFLLSSMRSTTLSRSTLAALEPLSDVFRGFTLRFLEGAMLVLLRLVRSRNSGTLAIHFMYNVCYPRIFYTIN